MLVIFFNIIDSENFEIKKKLNRSTQNLVDHCNKKLILNNYLLYLK